MRTTILCLVVMANSLCSAWAQNTYSISAGTYLVTGDNVNMVFGDGNLTNNGNIAGSNGTLLLTGAMNMSGTGTATLKNLTVNHTAAVSVLNTPIAVSGLLTVSAGTLNANGQLTLKSTSIASTAMVGIVGGSIIGDLTVERFIPTGGKRSFRFLSSEVTTTGSIRNNWQEGANNTATAYASNQDPQPGYGTHITGSSTGSNGLDATPTGNPSLYLYSNNSWSPLLNTAATALTAGVGYRLFIRGNRAFDLTQASPPLTNTATTLRAKGTITTGNMTLTSLPGSVPVQLESASGAYSFIGNPYVAPLDWHAVRANAGTSNIAATYYSWDPTVAGTNQRGKYVAYNQVTGMNDDGTSAIGRYIQPGQAFFVQNTGTNPSLQFTESNKAIGQNLTAVFRTQSSIEGRLWIRLFLKSELEQHGNHADGVGMAFSSSFNKAMGGDDAEKLLNADETMSILLNGRKLAITGLPLPATADTVQLELANMLGQQYVLQVEGHDFATFPDVVLEDCYAQVKLPVTYPGTVNLPFSIDRNDSLSSNSKRFRLLFNSRQSFTLPLQTAPLSIAPNPVPNIAVVTSGTELPPIVGYSIYSASGQLVLQQTAISQDGKQFSMEAANLPAGAYSLVVQTKGKPLTTAFVKQ